VDGEAQDVAIDGGEAFQFVVLGVIPERDIHCIGVFQNPADQSLAESSGRGAESTEGIEILEVGNSGATAEIALVEKLDGGLAAFASYSHVVG
jgi:hypothetical protein